MTKITPFLWFDDQAEEAVKFYVSIFENSKVSSITPYDEEGARAAGRPRGSVMTVDFELAGQPFTALNGGPLFKFTEAISFVVRCETQREVDHFWSTLAAGGQEVQCGWLKDRFGVSWQIVPTVLLEMLQDKDPEKSRRVMAAMLKMDKLDIKKAGVLPVAGAARYASLAAGIHQTSTRQRLRLAATGGALETADARALSEAFDLFWRLRLDHQVEQLRSGMDPDDLIDVEALDPLTRRYLRDALDAVRSVQHWLRKEHGLSWSR